MRRNPDPRGIYDETRHDTLENRLSRLEEKLRKNGLASGDLRYEHDEHQGEKIVPAAPGNLLAKAWKQTTTLLHVVRESGAEVYSYTADGGARIAGVNFVQGQVPHVSEGESVRPLVAFLEHGRDQDLCEYLSRRASIAKSSGLPNPFADADPVPLQEQITLFADELRKAMGVRLVNRRDHGK